MYRTGFATFFVIIGALLAGPAVVAYAIATDIGDRDQYLEAVGPLADDPEIQGAVADLVRERLTAQLPEPARELVDPRVDALVAGEEFRQAWIGVNEEAHPQLLAMLREEPGPLDLVGDAVVLDLAPLSAQLRDRLVAEGVPLADRIPDLEGSVTLVSRDGVHQVAPIFALLEDFRILLPVIAIVLLAGGIALSARRGSTMIVAGIGLAVMMLALVGARALARDQVATRSQDPELTTPFFDALTDRLGTLSWIGAGVGAGLLLVGILVAVVASRRRPRPAPYDYRGPAYPR